MSVQVRWSQAGSMSLGHARCTMSLRRQLMMMSESYLFGEILLKFGPDGAVREAGDDSEARVDVLADLVVHIGLPRHFDFGW